MSAFLAIADVLNPQKWDNFNWGYTSPAESLQSSAFGLVLLTFVLSFVLNYLLIVGVIRARVATGIKAPRHSECVVIKGKTVEAPEKLKLAIRGHHNNLEFIPFFNVLLLGAAIGFPAQAAFWGLVTLGFRTAGMLAYQFGMSRAIGAAFHVGEIALVYYTYSTAKHLIQQ